MKIILIILSLFFLGICVAGFFIPGEAMGIHIALMVSLLFYVRSLVVTKKTDTPQADV